MPRLYRESPLASIWEGSGNVQCLDVLRAMARNPASVEAFFAEVDEASGAEPRVDAAVSTLREELSDLEEIESRARTWSSGWPSRSGLAAGPPRHPAVADAFCASRLEGDAGLAFGTLPREPISAASSSATRRTCSGSCRSQSQRSSRRRTTASASRTASESVP